MRSGFVPVKIPALYILIDSAGHKPALTPLKAIKAKCYDCSAFDKAEQRRCEFKDCVIWPYRLGHNPKLKGRGDISRFTKKTPIQEPVLV